MKRIPFGYRFYLVSIGCVIVAELWLSLLKPTAQAVRTPNILLSQAAIHLTYLLAILIYYIFLGKILRPNVRKAIYVVFLLGSIFIGVTVVGRANEFFTIASHSDFTPAQIQSRLVISVLIPVLIAFAPPFLMYCWACWSEHPVLRRIFNHGKGGSSIWAGPGTYGKPARQPKLKQSLLSWPFMLDEGVTSDRIFLGWSLLDDDPFPRLVGVNDDSNLITTGNIGSGKSATSIYNILATHKSSILVNDCKGEHSRMTFRRRCSRSFLESKGIRGKTYKDFEYGEGYVLDPYEVNKEYGLKTSFYSFFSEADLSKINCRMVISAISDGCILPESHRNRHFEEMAKSFLSGLIAYILAKFPKHNHNLPFVLDLLYGINEDGFADAAKFDELLIDMLTCNAAGGLPQQAASELKKMGDRERGGVLSTLSRSLKWVGDPAMRQQLSGPSDFKFSELGIKKITDENGKVHTIPQTVYIVLPDTMMKSQMRWMRTLTSVGITLMQHRPEFPEMSTLWLLDEYARLGGQIKAISDGYATLRGYKIKLWVFLQNLQQLKADHPDRWSSMIGNSNSIFFGVNDLETAQYISDSLGKALKRRTEKRASFLEGQKVINETPAELLTAAEVMTKLGKGNNTQIVFPADGMPMRLERLAFKPLKIGGRRFRSFGLDGLRAHFEDW